MNNLKLFAIGLMSLLIISCQDEFTENEGFDQSSIAHTRKSDRTDPQDRGTNSTEPKTILGERRNNPFSVTNVNIAKVTLYGLNTPMVAATHSYVKFSPTTQDHLTELDLWETVNEIPLFDFPLEYEVITAGEYYHDEEVEDPLYTYQYASIPVSTPIPTSVPFEVVEDLYIDYSDPLLLAQSFHETGNGDEINEHFNEPNGIDPNSLGGGALGSIPPEPDCDEGYHPVLIVHDAEPPVTYEWICVEDEDPNNNTGSNLNECGCPIPFNVKMPAGCVQVDDDGTDVGVMSVTVKTKDTWFTSDFATTNQNGCWRVDDEYSGKMWMFLEFKNSACKIRDIGYWTSIRVLRDYIGSFKSPFNNNLVPYSDGTVNTITDEERMFWAACHSINTVVDYRGAVINDGILPPRSHLNVLNLAGSGPAAAPMLQGNPFNSWIALLVQYIPIANLVNFFTTSIHPDVLNKYTATESANSFTNVLYHELGHASHYRAVGEGYWFGYRNHIILNGGYGSFGSFNIGSSPGKVALGEAFGHFAANRYGNTAAGGEGSSFEDNFIPTGLMFDLMDNGADLIVDPNDSSSSVDNITGFTPAMIYNAMRLSSTDDIRKFRDRLRILHLADTPNSAAAFNTFVDQYDVFN